MISLPSGTPTTKQLNSPLSVSYIMDTEVESKYFDDILRFIQQNYLFPHEERFIDIERTNNGQTHILSYLVLVSEVHANIHVEIETRRQISVNMVLSTTSIPKKILEQLREDIFINIQLFEQKIRLTTLYFAWLEGKEIIPEKPPRKRHNIFHRMFSSGMLLLTIVLLTANIILFILVGTLAVLILIVFQLVTVLLSDKIIARTANWRITKENPNIHLMSYELPVEDYEDFQLEHGKDALIQIKAEIYEKTLAIGKALNCEVGGEVLSKYGFKCSSESILTKIVPVYEIVRKAADMFKLPIPKIVVSNTMTPNAAASGPSPNHGVMLITTGLLVELKEEEILSVVGHEFGHLKGMDPLVLFAITSAEFLFRFYIFWPLIINSGFNNFGFYYLLLSLGLIYFIAKLFESRADLQSAITIGQPTVLAEALRKIGFQRLQYERLRTNKILDWIGWDTHPPIYFRIGRLEKLEFPDKIRHLFIQSIKDNTRGFIAALH